MSDIKRNIRKLREMRVLVPWVDYSRYGIAFSPNEIILVSLTRTLALFIQATHVKLHIFSFSKFQLKTTLSF